MKLFAPAISLLITVLTLASCAAPGGRRTVYIEGEGDHGGNARESTFSGYRNGLGSSQIADSSKYGSIWTPAKSSRSSSSSSNYDYSATSTASSRPRRSLFGHSPLTWSKSSQQKTATASTTSTRRSWFSAPRSESSSRSYTVPQNSELGGLFSSASGGGSLRSSGYTAEPDGFGGYTTTSRNGSRIRWRPRLFGGYSGVSSTGQRYSIRPEYENRSLLKPSTSQGQLFDSGLGYDSGSLLHKNRGRSSLGNYSTGYSTLGSSSSRPTYSYGTSSYGVKKYGTSSGSNFGYGTSGSTYKPYSSSSSSGYGSLLKSGTGSSFGSSSSGYGYGKSSGGSSGYGSILK